MADKLMYIPNDDTQNYHFCRLQLVVETFITQLNFPSNQNSEKASIVLSQPIGKRYYKTLGTCEMCPPSMIKGQINKIAIHS